MIWSSKQIKKRREEYLKLGRGEERYIRQPVPVPTEERPARQIEGSTEFYFDEGLQFARAGRFDEAIVSFEKAIEINPLHYRAMSNLGLVYKNIFLENQNPEFLEEAIEWYNKAIEVNPNFSDVYNNLGDAYFNQQKYAQAEKIFKEAVRLDPLNVNAYNNLGVTLIMQEKREEALKYWHKSLEVNPDQPRIREYILKNE